MTRLGAAGPWPHSPFLWCHHVPNPGIPGALATSRCFPVFLCRRGPQRPCFLTITVTSCLLPKAKIPSVGPGNCNLSWRVREGNEGRLPPATIPPNTHYCCRLWGLSSCQYPRCQKRCPRGPAVFLPVKSRVVGEAAE